MLHKSIAWTGRARALRAGTSGLHLLLLALTLAFSAALRFCWATWDGGLWLHPDERQIYFVANGLDLPKTFSEAAGAASSLNPRFFAYGSLPIYLVRLVAVLLAPLWPAVRDPENLHLVGRPLAALLDVGTVALTGRLGARLAERRAPAGEEEKAKPRFSQHTVTGLLSAAFYGLAVLPIQSGHFYTADVLLTFLVMLCLNLASGLVREGGFGHGFALGVAVGLALATKLSAAPVLILTLVACWMHVPQPTAHSLRERLKATILALAAASATFVLVEPYAILDGHTFLAGSIQEAQIAWGRLDVPYTRQFSGTLPYLYPIWQTAVWGMGLPMGLLGWAGLALGLFRWVGTGGEADSLLLAWAGPYLALTGALHARPLRYMLPLVPVLCILGARLLVSAYCRATATIRRWLLAGSGVALTATLAYALVFLSAYASPHSWIVASEWIYRHVPAGTSLAVEEWDTPLPLPIDVDGRARRSEELDLRILTLYEEPDGEEKWLKLAQDLAASDYLVIASRRLYGSIARLPDRYPVAGRYYSLLFSGDLGFELAVELTRGVGWLNPRVAPLPAAAPPIVVPDESLVVYDRPRVLLFRNTGHLSQDELLARLGLSGQ